MKNLFKVLGVMRSITTQSLWLCAIALAALIGFSMIACDDGGGDDDPVTYDVTVIDGTGDGSYEAGETVTITATVPSGKQFVNWTVNPSSVTLNNVNSSSTYFTMPSNAVTVTANFSGGSSSGNNASINGAWIRLSESGSGTTSIGTVYTIINSDGYFTKIEGGWQEVMEKGEISIGDLYYRNITKKGERTWSCEARTYNGSTFALIGWVNCTLTLSDDGQSFIDETSSGSTTNPVVTYTRVQNNDLNGAWIRLSESGTGTTSIGTVYTIIGSDGYFTKIEGGWQKVMENGNINIGDLYYRNITKKGERTWSCEARTYNGSTFALASWVNCTLTLSADGKSFIDETSSGSTTNPIITYTKVQ